MGFSEVVRGLVSPTPFMESCDDQEKKYAMKQKIQLDRDSVSTLLNFKKSFFFKWTFLRKFIFKSVFQGVFWKDNAKGFLNRLCKEPVDISK